MLRDPSSMDHPDYPQFKGFFSAASRNAEKAAMRARDWADLEAGRISRKELAERNAVIGPSVDLSRWICVAIDESAWDDLS